MPITDPFCYELNTTIGCSTQQSDTPFKPINVMKKAYDTLYAAEVSCETVNKFSSYADHMELLVCTKTVTADELTGFEGKIGGILAEVTEALAEAAPNIRKHLVKDASK